MSSKVEIANRALQMVGVSKRLGTFEDSSQSARAIRTCYDILKFAELQRNSWTFAVRRLSLAAETDTPAFDYSYQYQLPADFVKIVPLRPKFNELRDDHEIEGRLLLSNDAGPINLRIISNTVDEELFHPLFVQGLANRIAFEIAEELTQSSAKKDGLTSEYVKFMADARRANAIEKGPVRPAVDSWETVRQGSARNTQFFRDT